MRNFRFTFSLVLLALFSLNTNAQTNDFYDDAPVNELKGSGSITVSGEVGQEERVSFTSLQLRSVIVKETELKDTLTVFTGAYKYDGYSLYDILNRIVLKKKNEEEFPPIIDLYVEISNDKGESVVFSWGEIYYPNNRHNIIIATAVTRIVPSKTKDLWPLPEERRVIAGNDLITCRNISNPTTIKVRSLNSSYQVNRDINPMYCEKMRLCINGEIKKYFTELPHDACLYTYQTVFYGRGKGIHGTTPFTGSPLSDFLYGSYSLSKEVLQRGKVVIAGIDGYRAAFTLSEIINRNDQQEFLLIDRDNYEGAGTFSLFPAADFFSDRAIKSIMEINILL